MMSGVLRNLLTKSKSSSAAIYLDAVRCVSSAASGRHVAVGDNAEITRVVTADDVQAFASVTGDWNPIHVDENVAKEGTFGQCIVHGAFLNGIISGLLGSKLPGPGTIVIHQYLEFPNALFVDEEVRARVEITAVKKSIIECAFFCEASHRKKIVLKGYAKLLHRHIKYPTFEDDETSGLQI